MLTHEELLTEWEEDSVIDKHQLDNAATTVPKLHHKYLKYYMEIKARRIALVSKLDVLIKDKSAYYGGQATADKYKEKPFDIKIRTKIEIQRYVDADPEIQAVQQKIEYSDLMLQGVEFILESIKWRNQSIKNAIEWARFTAGM